MRGNKKVRQNRFHPDASKSMDLNFDFMESLELCLKFIMIIIVISIVSLFFIFIHDGLTQAQYFSLNKISVSGNTRITRAEVLKQAGIVPGENIFSINLFKVKKRLIAGDWIADASVKRQIPSGIVIRIKEEKPLAVVKVGKKAEILINDHGVPFTEYHRNVDQKSDQKPDQKAAQKPDQKEINLPLVKGLNLEKKDGVYGFSGRPFKSLMNFLSNSYTLFLKVGKTDSKGTPYLTQRTCPVNLLKKIKGITIDRDMGLSFVIAGFSGMVRSDFRMKTDSQMLLGQDNFANTLNVKMGFDKYGARYKRIQRIIDYLKTSEINKKICSIDLSDLNNVIVKFGKIQIGDDFYVTTMGSIKGGV